MNDREAQFEKDIYRLLQDNTEAGYSPQLDTHYSYIKPSPSKYPFQWWWDTFFHVFILCYFKDYDLAKENLLSLFAKQRDDGFVGHMIYWQKTLPRNIFNIIEARPTWKNIRPEMSSLIQPTLAARALQAIYKGTGDKDYLREMLPRLKKYFEWLHDNRRFGDAALLSTIATMESGLDWKPSYDEVLGFEGKANPKLYWRNVWAETKNFINRYDLAKIKERGDFLVQDVCVNSLYAEDLNVLADLLEEVSDEQARTYRYRARLVGERIVEKLYDEYSHAFFDRDLKAGKQMKVLTPTIFLPLILPEVSEDLGREVIERHLEQEDYFWPEFPLPSVAMSESAYRPEPQSYLGQDFLWRGPTWMFYNWAVWRVLKQYGKDALAKRIKQATRSLVTMSKFREYYNPETGEGLGAKEFTWSGLVLMMRGDYQ